MITLIFGKVAVLGGATRLSPCPTIPIEQAQSSEPWYHAIPAERLSKRRTQPHYFLFAPPRTLMPSSCPCSDRNSMPARSSARRIASMVLALGSTTACSKRITEFRDTIARSANLWRVHPRKARAARTSRGVTIPGGKRQLSFHYH